jgi:hypothetical protein
MATDVDITSWRFSPQMESEYDRYSRRRGIDSHFGDLFNRLRVGKGLTENLAV